jgi:5'-methylthioadenosine phosphorylase
VTIKLAVIGGSGVYKLDNIKIIKKISVETPYGRPSSDVFVCEISGNQFYFIPRHGEGHVFTPSEVNYRANIFALKKLGATTVISISAVGSLKEECAPEDFVYIDQFIDWTRGVRQKTFFGEGVVGHVSAAYPIESSLQKRLYEFSVKAGIKSHLNGTYICIEGPQFSSRSESMLYKSFGAAVIGMTNATEANLAKEAGIAYATVAMVTDYDCWKDAHCEVQEIMKVMKNNYHSVQKLIDIAIPELSKNPIVFTPENKFAVITDSAKISEEKKEIINTLINS